jgi:hypothetical protein
MTVRQKKNNNEHDSQDYKWEMNFFELKKFKIEHGHCDVPHTSKNKKYRSLASWCNNQRVRMKFKPLTYHSDRLLLLNELGFNWNLRDKYFERKFRQLKQYREKYGHCNVSLSKQNAPYISLAYWVQVQRNYYRNKSSRLTAERIAKLNSIEFCWKNTIKPGDSLRIKDDTLVNEMKRLYLMRGIPPSAEFINKYGNYSWKPYYTRFGSISEAHKAAGINYAFEKHRKKENYT